MMLLHNLQILLDKYNFIINRQVLTVGSEERKLWHIESELLKYLWRKKNQIIDRRDILNLLWDNDSFLNSLNLYVFI